MPPHLSSLSPNSFLLPPYNHVVPHRRRPPGPDPASSLSDPGPPWLDLSSVRVRRRWRLLCRCAGGGGSCRFRWGARRCAALGPWALARSPSSGGALAVPPPPRVAGGPWPRCRPASGGWGLLATMPPPRVAATAYVCDYASYEFCDAVQYLYETFLKTNIPKIELGELHQIHCYSNILSSIYNLNTIVLKETTTFAKSV